MSFKLLPTFVILSEVIWLVLNNDRSHLLPMKVQVNLSIVLALSSRLS